MPTCPCCRRWYRYWNRARGLYINPTTRHQRLQAIERAWQQRHLTPSHAHQFVNTADVIRAFWRQEFTS